MASRKTTRAQELAKQRGFRTVYQMRQFEARNKAIGGAKAPTITRGLEQAKDTVRLNRSTAQATALARFGVTHATFLARHRANLEWEEKELRRRQGSARMQQAFLKSKISHTYDRSVAESNRWTTGKVGYVLSFYAANVNRSTRYESLFRGPYKEQIDGKLTQRSMVEDRGTYFLKMNTAQYYYLTQYTDLMTVADYEVSYGSQQTREAQAASLPGAVA